jgi:hypothetical protein
MKESQKLSSLKKYDPIQNERICWLTIWLIFQKEKLKELRL